MVKRLSAPELDLAEVARYDVVVYAGVLHHMADPELGLKRLVRALKGGGYLMVALYSARGRGAEVAARRSKRKVKLIVGRTCNPACKSFSIDRSRHSAASREHPKLRQISSGVSAPSESCSSSTWCVGAMNAMAKALACHSVVA